MKPLLMLGPDHARETERVSITFCEGDGMRPTRLEIRSKVDPFLSPRAIVAHNIGGFVETELHGNVRSADRGLKLEDALHNAFVELKLV